MKKLKFLLLILLFGALLHTVKAQKNAALYLKNGSVIYGTITENIPDSIVKIRDKCHNIWAVKNAEILNIKDLKKESQDKNRIPYYMIFDTGIAGFGGNGDAGVSLLISGVFNFKNRYYAGVTSGVESFGFPLLPIAAEFQADIFNRYITPYIYVRGGYAFKMIKDKETGYYDYYSESYKGGLMFGAGVGIKKRFSSDFALTCSIGYRHQETYEKREYISDTWWNSDYERYYLLNRAAVRVGLVF